MRRNAIRLGKGRLLMTPLGERHGPPSAPNVAGTTPTEAEVEDRPAGEVEDRPAGAGLLVPP